MSVLIKGLKMPENCEKCPIREGTFCDIINKDIDRFYRGSIKRDPDCPLVDLGKHGDLIDRNAFKADYGMKDDCADCEKEMRGKVKACRHDYIYSKMDLCYWLDDADVVIEAEDEE